MAAGILFHLIILLAGFTQGFTGFGSALVMLPLLTIFLNVKTVVPLVVLLGLGINVMLLYQVRGHIHWRIILLLLSGNVPGIFCGVYILRAMSTGFLELVIGLVLVAFPPYLMKRGLPEREVPAGWILPAGFLSGVLGGSVGAGGPPVILYTALQPWPKMRIKSTLVGFFLVTSVVTGALQARSGLVTGEVLRLFASGLPALVTGVLGGSFLFGRFDSGAYRKVLNIMLMGMGVFMLVKSVSGI